jgi:hypothetical protein
MIISYVLTSLCESFASFTHGTGVASFCEVEQEELVIEYIPWASNNDLRNSSTFSCRLHAFGSRIDAGKRPCAVGDDPKP